MSSELLDMIKTFAALGSLLAASGSLIFSIITWFYMRSGKRDEAITKQLDEQSKRISRIELDLNAMPTRQEIDSARETSRTEVVRIHERIDEINHGIQQSQMMLGELIGYYKGLKDGKS